MFRTQKQWWAVVVTYISVAYRRSSIFLCKVVSRKRSFLRIENCDLVAGLTLQSSFLSFNSSAALYFEDVLRVLLWLSRRHAQVMEIPFPWLRVSAITIMISFESYRRPQMHDSLHTNAFFSVTSRTVFIVRDLIRSCSPTALKVVPRPLHQPRLSNNHPSSNRSSTWLVLGTIHLDNMLTQASTVLICDPSEWLYTNNYQQALARLRAYVPPPTQWYNCPLTRRAAVLILLFPDRYGNLKVVLTMRASTLRSYAGQAALPGGTDHTSFHSALRFLEIRSLYAIHKLIENREVRHSNRKPL